MGTNMDRAAGVCDPDDFVGHGDGCYSDGLSCEHNEALGRGLFIDGSCWSRRLPASEGIE